MSSLLLRLLVCDECSAEFGDVARSAKTLGEVRKLAASAGWEVQAHTHGEDVCPQCRVKRITAAADAYKPTTSGATEQGDGDGKAGTQSASPLSAARSAAGQR